MIRILLALALFSAAAVVVPGRLHRMHDAVQAARPFDRDLSRTYDQVNDSSHGITEIAMEREETAGDGPSYAAFLYADGTIRFAGLRHPAREGMYLGHTTRWEYDALAQYIQSIGFRDLQHTYTGPGLTGSAVFTSVVRDGVRTVVRNDSRAGPPQLWALEQVIDKLLEDASWERTGDLEDGDR